MRHTSFSLPPLALGLLGLCSLSAQNPVDRVPNGYFPNRSAFTDLVEQLPMQAKDKIEVPNGAPIHFIQNRGQWAGPARFLVRGGSLWTWVEDHALTLDLHRTHQDSRRGVVQRLVFEKASSDTSLSGKARRQGVHNYLLGSEPSGWQRGVPLFAEVEGRSLYPGVDLHLKNRDGYLRYDLVLQAGADLGQVVIRVEGADRLSIAEDGSLVMHNGFVDIIQSAPLAWHVTSMGGRVPVTCRFKLIDESRYGFEVDDRVSDKRLVIDPTIRWSTFIGGTKDDNSIVLRRTAGKSLTIAGQTQSADYPVSTGTYQAKSGGDWDGFVSRFDPSLRNSAQLLWSTYLGGKKLDSVLDIRESADKKFVWFVGYSASTDFPMATASFQRSNKGGQDAVFGKLSASGKTLTYSSYCGGSKDDWMNTIILGPGGDVATICGSTNSSDFPIVAATAFQAKNAGMRDAFVSRFDLSFTLNKQLVYGTYLGGSFNEGSDHASPWNRKDMGLVVYPKGEFLVATQADSNNFPTTSGVYQEKFKGTPVTTNAITVSKIDPSQKVVKNQLVWSTYISGGTSKTGVVPYDMQLDGLGNIVIGGISYDPAYPTTRGAFAEKMASGNGVANGHDAILSILSNNGKTLLYSTFLGGSRSLGASRLAIETSGTILMAGFTFGVAPTTPGAPIRQRIKVGPPDGVLFRIRPSGKGLSDLQYGTYFGGTGGEACFGNAGDDEGGCYLTGVALSPDFPTTGNAFQSKNLGGPRDAWVAHFDTMPIGVDRVGSASKPCAVPLFLMANGWPSRLRGSFSISSNGAPARTVGLLTLGTILAKPVQVFGVDLWMTPIIAMPIGSDSLGYTEIRFPIPPSTRVASKVGLQAFWFNGVSCGPIQATQALNIVIQP